MGFSVCGRNIKLGDGFDAELNHITPFQCVPSHVTKGNYQITHFVYTFKFTDQGLLHFLKIGPYLADSCLRQLNHRIVFDQNQYNYVQIEVITKFETCEILDRYHGNCPSFINKIDYGMELGVVFRKQGFPNTKKLKTLIENVLDGCAELTADQKLVSCRVLVNHKETKKMTWKELVDFVKEFKQGQHQEYLCPVIGEAATVKKIAALKINDFRYMSANLYTAFRKIEIKLEEAGYPGIFLPEKTVVHSIVEAKARHKSTIQNIVIRDWDSLYETYFILKRIWFAHIEYLQYCIDNRIDFKIKDGLHEFLMDIMPDLRRLNTWTPVKTGNRWGDENTKTTSFNLLSIFSSKEPESILSKKLKKWTFVESSNGFDDKNYAALIVPEHFKNVEQKMKQTKKLKNLQTIPNNSVNEPLLLLDFDVEALFGFVNMSGARDGTASTAGLEHLNTECPRHCTADVRIWICSDCGCVVRIKTLQQLSFVCDCGSKNYDPCLLKCVNPEHEELLKIDLLPDNLKRITNQLKRHQNRHDEEANALIRNAVQTIIHSRDPEELTGVITQMSQLTVFDGDTNHLLSQYLEPFRGKGVEDLVPSDPPQI